MIPKISLFVGACALTFQATVLYPWHNKIDQDIRDLQKSVDKLTPNGEKTVVPKDSSCSFAGLNIFHNKKYFDFKPLNPKHPYYFYEHMNIYKTSDKE